MKTQYLNIVLLEDLPFKEVVMKLEKAFTVRLPYENKKGRLVAMGETKNYIISVVDRIDDLGEFLTDDYHILEIIVGSNDSSNNEKIESEVKENLKREDIKWQSGIWSRLNLNEEYRKMYPDS